MAAGVRSQEASSSSSYRSTNQYHVFLSFRGADTGKTFADHLYTALYQAGFRTFRHQDDIEKGESIKSEVEKAIKQSRVSIVVFSNDYAASKRCLDELVMILKHRREFGHTVFPVFYNDLDPSTIRKQNGRIAEAFAGYEEQSKVDSDNIKNKKWMDKIEGWRVALRESADLPGMVFKNEAHGHEAKFIEKILKVLEDKLNRVVLSVAPHLIGIHSRVKNINLWVQNRSSDIGILVIWGMSGIGKTTIAKVVYNLNFQHFEGSSFLANIREVVEQPYGLLRLQTQILSNILKGKKEKIYNVDEGTNKIIEAICCKRILVVLDDVDDVELLDALVGRRQFHPGTKIIITTRNKLFVKAHYKVHAVEKLDVDESLELFSWHAFGQDHPMEGYVEISKRIVYRCGGIPLAHQVLGGSLCGKNRDLWESAVRKLESIPDGHILQKLKVSYESLRDDHDRNLFLHIACFFVRKTKNHVVKILDKCGFFTIVGIESLIDRCLITIEQGNKLMVHQLLQEMGREIVHQESPNDPGKRSRLWHHEDSFEVLKENRGTRLVEGLSLDMTMFKEDKTVVSSFNLNRTKRRWRAGFLNESLSVNQRTSLKRRHLGFFSWEPVDNSLRCPEVEMKVEAFSRMDQLKILLLNSVHLTGSYEKFPNKLRWLSWHGFPLKFIPMDLNLEYMVVLDMRYSTLEQVSWEANQFLGSLKIFNLSYSRRLYRIHDFSRFPNLQRLILKGCTSLIEICESIGSAQGLALLNLDSCTNIMSLPRSINMLKCLETLIISGCSNLIEFPKDLMHMQSLKVLHADGIATDPLPADTSEGNWWQAFASSWVSAPKRSPEVLWDSLPRSLARLSLKDCNLSENSFPEDFKDLSLLNDLDLSKNPICSLPNSIKNLSKLQTLHFESCPRLQSLLDLPKGLDTLWVGHCTSLERIGAVSNSLNLRLLQHTACKKLVEIQGLFRLEPIGQVDIERFNNMGWFNLQSMGNAEVNFHDGISLYTKRRPIQGLFEFGIYSTFFPGKEVPSWFSERNEGSTISFMAPLLPNARIIGLNVCSLYGHSTIEEVWSPHPLFTKVTNKTKDLNWIYCPTCYGIPQRDKDLVWLSHWKFGSQLVGGDEVDVSIVVGEGFEVKGCGISLLYQDEQEDKRAHDIKDYYLSWEEVIGGDLSSFQLTSGAYFLCRHGFSRGNEVFPEDDWTTTDWFQILFGNSIEFSELIVWDWSGRWKSREPQQQPVWTLEGGPLALSLLEE